jgi:RND family efflux transporter MFP subunit
VQRWRRLSIFVTCLLILCGLSSCGEKQDASLQQVIRGLRAYKVSAYAESRTRRFSSVLQPSDVSRLSFEISGQLKAVNLEAGQRVHLGDVLTEIDPRSLQAQVEQASAGVKQAEAQLANAEGDFGRKSELLKKGVSTQASFDQSQATLLTTRAQLDQAQRQLDLATHNLDRSKLLAPFDGIISGVEVKSFVQVAPGQAVVTLYSDDSFEMSFLAPAAIFPSLKVGQPAKVQVADRPELSLTGVIKELGARAEQVSAFPVVVRLKNDVADLNAGMSVAILLELPLISASDGYLVPLSVLVPEGGKDLQGAATVFLYDAASSTVHRHRVTLGGVRDNQLVVTAGLNVGDLVASAGVSYLTEGQKVKLLPVQE